jgi:hypothetical protein
MTAPATVHLPPNPPTATSPGTGPRATASYVLTALLIVYILNFVERGHAQASWRRR